MAILRLLPFALLAACYSPDRPDCKVTCNGAADCAPDQVCGADGYCAAADVAGTCSKIASTDAGTDAAKPPTDSSMPPADAPPATVRLRVEISGRGDVSIPTVGECDGGSGQTVCNYDVPKNAPITLNALSKNMWMFEKWDHACKDALTQTCVLAPMNDVQVKATFKQSDDD